MTRAEIVAAARSYLDVPYHHQGRNRAGLDCIGLIVCVVRDFGMVVEDITNYSVDPEPEKLLAALGRYLDPVPTADALPGDVALFRVRDLPQHTGILTDIGLIHSYSSPSANRVVETVLSNWAERMVAAYRIPGVTP